VHAPPGRWCGRLARSPELKRLLARDIRNFDVVHNHSLWMLPTSYAARSARRSGVPVVFTVHGFLEPWALAHSRWKKRLAGWAFQDRDLHRADCIHVNSRSELASIRAYGLRNPVAIIPNGINLGHFDDMPPGTAFASQFPELRGKRICLFLSRLHEKKGLGHLVEAWSQVARDFGDWQLVIAGPNDGYEPLLRERIAALGVESSVTITGPLYGPQKFAAYSAAEVFVLPSFSEGFSMAILEALAAGLPVLMTPGCNFPEAQAAGAAVMVQPNAEETAAGLRRLISLAPAGLSAMGQQGRQLVKSSYTWNRVADQLLAVYGWLRDRGNRPDCVVTA
jgi:poly(glycerol-phosphate) alpha-glucosyltransferase